jgi:hypothetical protein
MYVTCYTTCVIPSPPKALVTTGRCLTTNAHPSSRYDQYIDDNHHPANAPASRQSGAAALGMLMSGGLDSDDDSDTDEAPPPRYNSHSPPAPLSPEKKRSNNPFADPSPPPPQNQHPIPLAAPKPGYVAPVTQFSLKSPPPAAMRGPTPEMRQLSPQMPHQPQPQLHLAMPDPIVRNGTTPHPLPAMSPITPVFARPAKPGAGADGGVTFASEGPIIRGDGEGTVLPRRGEKGDDFWRRFSMVVKEEAHKKDKERCVRRCSPLTLASFRRS